MPFFFKVLTYFLYDFVFSICLINLIAELDPAVNPVLQQFIKLKPPVTPSTSITSPQKYNPIRSKCNRQKLDALTL